MVGPEIPDLFLHPFLLDLIFFPPDILRNRLIDRMQVIYSCDVAAKNKSNDTILWGENKAKCKSMGKKKLFEITFFFKKTFEKKSKVKNLSFRTFEKRRRRRRK